MSARFTATSAKPERTAGHRLIVSFHDLHPGSRTHCERLLAHLAEAGIDRASLLVVPRWHGARPVTHDPEFTAWLGELAEAGHDICLHGFTHRAESVKGGPVAMLIGRQYTQSEGEFFQISYEDALRRVRDGLSILADEAGLPIYGFTPPAWLLSREGRTALADAGLLYTTTWSGVELLQSGESVRSPTLVYSCRNRWRRMVSRAWVLLWHQLNRHRPLLRLAVHPGDLTNPRLEASLVYHLGTAVAAGRTAITYRDLLPPGTPPVDTPAIAVA